MCKVKDSKYKVYTYGMGKEYNKLSSYLTLYKSKLEILGIVTTEKQDISSIDGYPCMTVKEIDLNEMDYVIIAVIKWKEILDILDQYGVTESKIIRSTAFYSPCFDLDGYLKLKNSNISILANYCLGGFIYKELGLKVLSPTVNMFCLGDGYLEFLENYPYYLSLQMQEHENDTYIEGTIGREAFLPKGILGNKVVWYFNHHIFAKDAVNDWNEKAKRVNFNNVASIMILHNDEEAYRFSKLNIDKKLGIYYKNLGGGIKNVICCSKWNDPREQAKYDWNWPVAANRYFSAFEGDVSPVNWIKFLNEEANYMRYKE